MFTGITDPHRDTVSTITLPANNQTNTGIDAYATFDEYGQAETGGPAITTGGLNYGWVTSAPRGGKLLIMISKGGLGWVYRQFDKRTRRR